MSDNERVLMRHPETGGEFLARPQSVNVHKAAGWQVVTEGDVAEGDVSTAGEAPAGDAVPAKKPAAKPAADAPKES